MALIPMNQTVKIQQDGGLDDWGQPMPGRAKTYSCRVDQTSELVRNRDGNEVVSKATIMLDGIVKVAYADTIEFTDETGNQYSSKPVNISILRDFAGKPLITKVVI